MDIYDRINHLLIENKTNKRKMSFDLNIPYTTLASMFSRRSANVDVETMKKIAKYLNTTLEYLVSGNEEFKYCNSNNIQSNTIIAVKNDNKKYYSLNDNDFNAIITILENLKQ